MLCGDLDGKEVKKRGDKYGGNVWRRYVWKEMYGDMYGGYVWRYVWRYIWKEIQKRGDMYGASQVALVVKNLLAHEGDTETQIQSLGWEDPME